MNKTQSTWPLRLTESGFDFIDAMIQLIFVYRVCKKKQHGVQLGLHSEALDDYIREVFIDYPVYGFICDISEDFLDISERPCVDPLRGIKRQQKIANIFLLEKKNKYNDYQLRLFGLFEVFKGISHIYGSNVEKIAIRNADIVARGFSNCIGCYGIPSNKCTLCMQIVYCSNRKCLRVEHNCHHDK